MFMRMFGPLLFRPSPPGLFDTKIDLENFMDSPEPKRITEVLSLYYVVLLRDKSNLVCDPFQPIMTILKRFFSFTDGSER